MKSVPVTFGPLEKGLHMRPAALVVKLAALFDEHEIRLHKPRSGSGEQADLKSIMGVASAGILAGEHWWLTVTGPHEAVVAALVQAFLNNLHLAASLFGERESTPKADLKDRKPSQGNAGGPESLLESMGECLWSPSVQPGERDYGQKLLAATAEMLWRSHRGDVSRAHAVLNSPKGLHVASAQILAEVARLYKSKIMVTFVNSEGKGESCNAAEVFELLGVAADDGTTISIQAKGPDSHEAVGIIKHLVERMGEIEEVARRRRVTLKTKSDLIQFLREILHLGPHDLPSS